MKISLADIVSYIGEGIRPIKEGEQVFLAGHVISCGKSGPKISAQCLQTSKVSGPPHKIELYVGNNLEMQYQRWICTCSCKAGAGGKCKHIVAVLLHLNKAENVLEFSCTDLEQVWGKSKTQKYTLDAIPIKEYCHVKNREIAEEAISQNFLQLFTNAVEDSEATIHLRQIRETNRAVEVLHIRDNLEDAWKNVVLQANNSPYVDALAETPVELEECCRNTFIKLYTCDPIAVCKATFRNNSVWSKERQFRVTASRCYSLLTYSKENWNEKAKKYFFPTPFSNLALEYGRAQESYARDAYNTLTHSKVVECGLCVFAKEPWLAVSPDGIIMGPDGLPNKLLEIKCPGKRDQLKIVWLICHI